jgi:hypothetical protein
MYSFAGFGCIANCGFGVNISGDTGEIFVRLNPPSSSGSGISNSTESISVRMLRA